MPENLLESELFGHEKGSFTGAHQTRRGIFELADHGTLLLDEIGDASPQIQVKLLRVLETGEFMRVGGSKPIKTDVRIIAATNVDLEEAIREKTFREDLYYRLNVVRLDIPPLRSRADDIPLLAEQAVRQINPKLRISQGAMRLLQNYGWPGNVRELINIIRRAAAICSGDTIMPDHLGSTFSAAPADGGAALPVLQASPEAQGPFLSLEAFCDHYSRTAVLEKLEREDFDRLLASLSRLENSLVSAMRDRGLGAQRSRGLKDTEEETIRKTLDRCQWNITETARVLGIGRNTLYRKIKEYNLANH